ncbi:MAG: hypothetical protein HQM14_15575 [SAR324 cluster bacterium]|nr:hypothetical protein [SAR324 cluster bacterium]
MDEIFELRVDFEKNRLYITFIGQASVEDAESFLSELSYHIAELKPGFAIISNLLEQDFFLDEEVESLMPAVMKFLSNSGAGIVIRVIPESLLGDSTAQLFDEKSSIAGYTAKTVHSIAEAEQLLDELL